MYLQTITTVEKHVIVKIIQFAIAFLGWKMSLKGFEQN